ncbi:hypothetical protein BD410DRAFT_780446 [Rickenella mellea]|uniref:Uncharacterized protein n=1 Tax=Rickenella mellea TaxID=50990 RepID=A0A4R5XFL7_9AGAM|nr:hypothetical protein BD410DRAFT_780446 [Rickenella mellea]
MSTYVEMYNSLPTLGEADDLFVHRDTIFAKLAPLLSKYNHQFGVCLVHAHCQLDIGEKMVATGNICEPRDSSSPIDHYPERWLKSGEPFEFTTNPTPTPPPDLFSEFQKIIGDVAVLGLYFADGPAGGVKRIEWTEGRKNITRETTEEEVLGSANITVETAWLPQCGGGGKTVPETVCQIWCDTRTTRSGNHNKHKGTKTHGKVPVTRGE